MAAVTIYSNFGAQENKVCHHFHFFHIYLPWTVGTNNHYSLDITIQSRNGFLLLHKIRKKGYFKIMIFFFLFLLNFLVSSWGTHLLNFFIFPICFKCWMTIEWLTLNSLSTSYVVARGSALMILFIGCCQLPMAGHYAHLQRSCLLCKISWTTIAL